MTVRLWSVGAPKKGQTYGLETTKAAQRYIGEKEMRITVEEIGGYGRAVARIEVQGGSLSRMLARDGMAWHNVEYAPNATELGRLETQARNANRGLWAQGSPIPPWQWREMKSSFGETSAQDRDCPDFDTQPEARRFLEANQPGDPHNLDGDGIAGESSPGG